MLSRVPDTGRFLYTVGMTELTGIEARR